MTTYVIGTLAVALATAVAVILALARRGAAQSDDVRVLGRVLAEIDRARR